MLDISQYLVSYIATHKPIFFHKKLLNQPHHSIYIKYIRSNVLKSRPVIDPLRYWGKKN